MNKGDAQPSVKTTESSNRGPCDRLASRGRRYNRISRLSVNPFSCQKNSFAIHAPTIAGNVSVVTYNSVARNGDRKCVRAASLPD